MKKFQALVLCVVFMLLVSACGGYYTEEQVSATLTAIASGEEVQASTPTPTNKVEEEDVTATPASMIVTAPSANPNASAAGEVVTVSPVEVSYTINGAPSSVDDSAHVAGFGEFESTECQLPAGCFMVGDPGVIGVGSDAEAAANASAVLIGPDTQELLENSTGQVILPESGYGFGSGAGYCGKLANGLEFCLEPEENHAWFVVLRGLNHAAGDNNLTVNFSDLDVPGAVLYTQYPVQPDDGAFFSYEYLLQNVNNAHAKGCGDTGCAVITVLLMDANNGAWAIIQHTRDGEWEVVDGNLAFLQQ